MSLCIWFSVRIYNFRYIIKATNLGDSIYLSLGSERVPNEVLRLSTISKQS